MLHGAFKNGKDMSEYSNMHYKFEGIIAYPSSVPALEGWPIYVDPQDPLWVTNLQTVTDLIALPDVDSSRVYILGFSSGGFYAKALECAIGNQIKYSVVLAALNYIQGSCDYHTNVLHIHNRHDTNIAPIDPPNGTKPDGGRLEIGYPTTLRSNWCSGSAACPTNGQGNKTGGFTYFNARRPSERHAWDYYFYDGVPDHNYHVYTGVPEGAPHGLGMEEFIIMTLTGKVPPLSPPVPPKPPTPKTKKGCHTLENPTCMVVTRSVCLYYGCKKCHDESSWDCAECCTPCSLVSSPKGVHYCAATADVSADDLV